ncbi:hypothetical protein TCDM_13609 [Trypanosoma cruzi Dm28c]|uniref:Uncharacterized protein n=1 Tax=Trypanosoma cruzi Dm28c TaxID=1416333 RepID=V5CHV5_TRYCR|nr:hypothetical protein TCDM_13609 [Trypanosoma cruzi Dm28c]
MCACVFQRLSCLPFAFVFVRVRLWAISLPRRRRLKKKGRLWSMHPRLQCSSTDADFSCQDICARFSLHYLFFFHRGGNMLAFVSAAAGCCFPRRDALNGISSMTLCTKGMERSSDPHRRRMPWTAEKECVPGVVHSSKEKMVLDGARRVDVDYVDRASQVYPLEALRAAVATCEYNTYRGKNIFNWSRRWNPMCSVNGLARGVAGGDARQVCHQHRHSFPLPRQQRSPRQYALRIFRGDTRCSVCRHCSPSPSVGADVPVDATSCGFRTHPLIDAAGTAAHCWCFLHDCCTAPSSWCSGTGDEITAEQVQSDGAGSPVGVSPNPTAYPHHRRAQKSTGQGRHQRSVRTPVVLRLHLQSSNRMNLKQHHSPTMKKEQRQPPTATAAPRSFTPSPIFFILSRMQQQLRWWLRSHELACAEGERRPMATELFL